MKTLSALFAFATLLTADTARACKLTPIGASTLVLGAVNAHLADRVDENYRIKRVIFVTQREVRVDLRAEGRLREIQRLAVEIAPDCSTSVHLLE
jgi:hypothetical protein